MSDAQLVRFINDAYYDICTREAWPFLETTYSGNLVVSQPKITAITTLSKVLSFSLPALSVLLEPRSYQWLTKKYSDLTRVGLPSYYYFDASSLNVYPVPDSAYAAVISFIKTPNTLTASSVESDILLPARHHRILVTSALSRAYTMEDDFDVAAVVDAQSERRYQLMREDLWTRQYDRPDIVEDIYDQEFN